VATPTNREIAHTHDDAGHGHSDRFYWMVALVLVIVTALEVTLFVVNESGLIAKWIEIAVLLMLSTIKGAAVVMYFMHLKGDAKIFQFVFIVPFSFAVTLLLMFLAIFANYEGIAG
jgi:cytochrome c oxidase subunit 4/cytochrome o ubiquinol oxidase operon protein cyoD